MPATLPATLATLQALQSLIIAHTGTTFAALSAADQARYGVARAVYVGAPKDFKDYLPQLHLVPTADAVVLAGAMGRVEDTIAVDCRVVVEFNDWWAAEQSVLAIRDTLLALLLARLRAGGTAGLALVASGSEKTQPHGEFATLLVAGTWYRTWTLGLALTQVYVPVGGLSG